jgi:hypothetical protein
MATLYSVIKTLEGIALSQPNVRSAGDGSLYDFMNGDPSVKYSAFFVTQNKHTTSLDLDYDIYSLNLFHIDRLRDDKTNELECESTAKEVLNNIINRFCAQYDADVVGTIEWQSFTEHFKDECAGMYATVKIRVPIDVICPE